MAQHKPQEEEAGEMMLKKVDAKPGLRRSRAFHWEASPVRKRQKVEEKKFVCDTLLDNETQAGPAVDDDGLIRNCIS